MKAISYVVVGLIIGAILGAMLGVGNTYYTKKSQKDADLKVQVPLWTVIGAVGCAIVGGSWGMRADEQDKKRRIEEAQRKVEDDKLKSLGLYDLNQYYTKDGRYWVGISNWTNPATNQEYKLLTARTTSKVIVSALNDRIIINHHSEGANKQNVMKLRNMAIIRIVEAFKKHGDWVGETMGGVSYSS